MCDVVYSLAVYVRDIIGANGFSPQDVKMTMYILRENDLTRRSFDVKNTLLFSGFGLQSLKNDKLKYYENPIEISCCVWQSLFMFVFCEHSWIIDQSSQQMRPNTGLPHAFNMHAIRTKLIYKTAAIELHSFAFFSIIEFRKSKDHPEYHRVVN